MAANPGGRLMPVYFIQAGEGGPIKIGHAANVRRRVAGLRTACPTEILARGYIAGDEQTERALHRQFNDDRVRGEWFRPSAALLAVVAEAAPIFTRKARQPTEPPPLLDIPFESMTVPQHIDQARRLLLNEVAGFIVERNITETTFGRLAVNDGKFVARLRSTGNMTTALIAKAHDFICAERSKAKAAWIAHHHHQNSAPTTRHGAETP